jgi:hypothetical protein
LYSIHSCCVGNVVPFKTFVRDLLALAFLPVARVLVVYNHFLETFSTDYPEIVQLTAFQIFIRYYSSQWLANEDVMKHWNVADRGKRRTNNNLEGWHHKINEIFGPHPGLYKLMAYLVVEQMQSQVLSPTHLPSLSSIIQLQSVYSQYSVSYLQISSFINKHH